MTDQPPPPEDATHTVTDALTRRFANAQRHREAEQAARARFAVRRAAGLRHRHANKITRINRSGRS